MRIGIQWCHVIGSSHATSIKIWGCPCKLWQPYPRPSPKNVLKVNASATTFCRLFCSGTFWRPKKGCWPFGIFLVSFWHPFGGQKEVRDFLLSFSRKKDGKKSPRQFWTRKGRCGKKTAKGFFVLQKDAKKTPKGCRTNFVLQLVGNLFWTLKGRLSKKDGKKSWHSHSAKVNQDSLQVLLLQQQKQRSKTPTSRRNSKLRKKNPKSSWKYRALACFWPCESRPGPPF